MKRTCDFYSHLWQIFSCGVLILIITKKGKKILNFTCHQTFRMLNVRPLQKNMRNGAELALGFPLLEELCIATTSYSYMTDKYLWDVLFGSPRLRVLDLRGCSRITSEGLAALPCLGKDVFL